MRRLFVLLNLIAVAALLTLGAGSTTAMAQPMPCHEMASSGHSTPEPSHQAPQPSKAAMVMACCVACVAPSPTIAPTSVPVRRPRVSEPVRVALPVGRSPSPEPGPPRLTA